MNRFLRTAYWSAFVYLLLSLIAALSTGVGMPFPAFMCLYFGLLVGLIPGAAQKLKGKETLFGLLGILIALAGFAVLLLYKCGTAHLIIHGIGLAFAWIFVFLLKHRTTHFDFAAKFRFSVVFIIILIAAMYIALLIGITEELVIPLSRASVKQAVDHAVPIAIMMLVTGVLLLRGLRGMQGTMNEKEFNRRQLRDVLIYAAGVSAVFLINPYIYRGLVWLMNKVVLPALRGLGWLFNKLLELLANKNPNFGPSEVVQTPGPTESLPPLPEYGFTDKEPENYMIDEAGESTLYNTILYIFIAVAAAVLLAILIIELRNLIIKLKERASSRGKGYPNEIRESLAEEETESRAERPKKRSADPRLRIRYFYKEFLRLLHRDHVRLEPSDTCGNINDRAEKVMHRSADELREMRGIYEKARYRAEEPPTEEEAARMKAIYERLKNGR